MSVGDWRGPHERWPTFGGKKDVSKALKKAKSVHRWWLRPSQGHVYGQMSCRPPGVKPRCDAQSVYSTAPNTAHFIESMLRSCPHESPLADDEIAALEEGRPLPVPSVDDTVDTDAWVWHTDRIEQLLNETDELRSALTHIDLVDELEAGSDLEDLLVEEAALQESLAAIYIDWPAAREDIEAHIAAKTTEVKSLADAVPEDQIPDFLAERLGF